MSPVNTDELEAALYWAERRVLEIQAKLHRWAIVSTRKSCVARVTVCRARGVTRRGGSVIRGA